MSKRAKRKIGGDMPTGVFITDTATNNPETIKRLLMQKKKFAWLIKPLPAKFVMNFVLPVIPMKLLKMGEVIHHGTSGSVRVITWGYPRTPKWMYDHPDRSVRELVGLARHLEKIGADKICLGANTKGVGDKGKTIQTSVSIPVTNGNRSTIGWAVEGTLVLAALLELDLSQSTATVVGPGGSVGDGVCRMLLKAGVKRLFLVGSTPGKQNKQAKELSTEFGGRIVEDRTLMDALRESQIAVFASSATSRETRHAIILSQLPTGLIVVDMERPRGVSAELEGYTFVLANDGTMVAIDSEGQAGLGLPPGIYFPCYSELVLMLLIDRNGKWCYPATLEEIESIHKAAKEEGFTMASFRLNDKPITQEVLDYQIEFIRQLKADAAAETAKESGQ